MRRIGIIFFMAVALLFKIGIVHGRSARADTLGADAAGEAQRGSAQGHDPDRWLFVGNRFHGTKTKRVFTKLTDI